MRFLTLAALFFAAASAAAPSVDQPPGKLATAEDGTYIASAWLDAQPVRLFVDASLAGVWVKCSVFESVACETIDKSVLSGYETKTIRREGKTPVVYKSRRFARIRIAEMLFSSFDVNVVYGPLSFLPPRADGVWGLAGVDRDWVGRDVAFTLQLGRSSSSEVFSDLDAPSAMWKTGSDVAIRVGEMAMSAEVNCVQVVGIDEKAPALPCVGGQRSYDLDPGVSTISLPTSVLTAVATKYLQPCTPVMDGYHIHHYACETMKGANLPTLAFEINSWRVLVLPREYAFPLKDHHVVMLGDSATATLGTPFLRSASLFVNTTARVTALFCFSKVSCEIAWPNATTLYNESYDGLADKETTQPEPTSVPRVVESTIKNDSFRSKVARASTLTLIGLIILSV